MKFAVTRTSDWRKESAPVPEAVRGGLDEYGENVWYVEIPDLESLVAFAKTHRRIILRNDEIEIYDDYRE